MSLIVLAALAVIVTAACGFFPLRRVFTRFAREKPDILNYPAVRAWWLDYLAWRKRFDRAIAVRAAGAGFAGGAVAGILFVVGHRMGWH